VYRIIPDTTVSDQITALPTDALPHLTEVLATLDAESEANLAWGYAPPDSVGSVLPDTS
jgi:hypothetical protein